MATKQKTARQRVQFAFNADTDSVVGAVFQYLIKNHRFNSREGKQKGIDAMLAFYKPFAYQGQEDITEGELVAMARDAVETLSRQIDLLCATFDVERPGAIAPDLRTSIQQTIADVLATELVRVQAIASKPSYTELSKPDLMELALANGWESFDSTNYTTLLGDLQSNAEAVA